MEDADDKEIGAAIEALYAGAVTVGDPMPLLARIAACVGYEVLGIATARSRYATATCNACYGLDLALCQRFDEKFAMSLSVRKLHGREMRAGEFAFREELLSDDEFRQMPFYRDFVVPNRLDQGLKLCLENSPERLVFANFARPVPGADRERQRRIVARLAPHWVRAHQIWVRLGQAHLLHRAYADSADMTPFAMVVYDNSGALYLANRMAQRLLGCDSLALRHDGLHAGLKSENDQLQQAIRAAVAASNAPRYEAAETDLRITRASGQRDYQVVVTSLAPEEQFDGRRPAATVAIFDPHEAPRASLERCRALFEFTRAEAEVAMGIMQGRTLEQIAAAQGNTVATSRNLLKRVFQKTGVNRQSELTRLLLMSALQFAAPAAQRGAENFSSVRSSAR